MIYHQGTLQAAEQHVLCVLIYVVENKLQFIVSRGKKEHKDTNFLVWKPRCGSTTCDPSSQEAETG